jgi:hypothetical protein
MITGNCRFTACLPAFAKHNQDMDQLISRKILEKVRIAHEADPKRVHGRAAESLYAEQILRWVRSLVTDVGDILSIAACCQHLERWSIARSTYPMDRVGYLQWRKALQARQGERAREIALQCGAEISEADRIALLVAKKAPKGDRDAQALEDAACLVFLESELQPFAAEHADYTRDKFIDIITKTWAKMSARGHELAQTIALPPALQELVAAALRA